MKLKVPFKIARAKDAHEAVSESFRRISRKRINSKPYKDAVKNFLKQVKRSQ